MQRLQDQVAIVTGAADGIGRAIAGLFAREGARVCVADVDERLGRECVEQLREEGFTALFQHTDIASSEAVASMVAHVVAELGPPTILVNNAAIINVGSDVMALSEDSWRQNFAVNVDGMWHCCKAVLPHMRAAGAGSIVNIGSVHSFKIVPNYFPYAVTKHAVIGLTRNLAVEFAADNIRVNALCPGMVETPAAFRAWDKTDDPQAARDAIARVHPLQRNGSTEEIAYPALFLASQESSFMTGQSLIVDGGRSIIYHD